MRAHIRFVRKGVKIDLSWGLRLDSIFSGLVILLSCEAQQVLFGNAFHDARFGRRFGVSPCTTLVPEPEEATTVRALFVHVQKTMLNPKNWFRQICKRASDSTEQ